MPWRRGDASSPRQRPGSERPAFRPIRLVRVDVDAPRVEDRLDADRVWIEATRGGHVVGLVDARAHDGTLSKGLLEGLATAFAASDVPVTGGDTVDDERLPSLSVVVPTLGAHPERLARTVASILACEYPHLEVLVVDNRRGAPATALAGLADDPRVRVVREATPGISAARNRGTAESSGHVVAFTDDDVTVDPGWVRALGARFATDAEVDGLGGLVLPSELDTEPQLWFEEYYGGFSQSFHPSTVSVASTLATDALFPYAPGRFGAGCNMAFRRATLDAQGGFDTTLGTGTPAKGGEDLSFFISVLLDGGTLGFEPSAVVRHSHRRTEPEFLRQVLDYGTGLSAMYTSLLAREPRRHVVELARRVPAGLRRLVRPRAGRSASATPSYPRRALAYQLVGIAYGPIAYVRSRRAAGTTTPRGPIGSVR